MGSTDSLWEQVAKELRNQLKDSVWFSTFSAVSAECTTEADGMIAAKLSVPSIAVRDRINTRFLPIVQATFDDVCSTPVTITVDVVPNTATTINVDGNDHLDLYLVGEDSENTTKSDKTSLSNGMGDNFLDFDTNENDSKSSNVTTSSTSNGHNDVRIPSLNNRYTFESFVIGSSNRFAHAAALAVAETPSRSYNPLFIHGDAGLGKTHLLQAIAHYVKSNYPHYRVCYVTTETLMSELVEAIRRRSTLDFKRRYRENDVLLIDDIQFLTGKDALQEEVFHTFNDLHQANRQIVLSSDRPPDAIATLEDRLRSRFKQGLLTDIQPPDIETRLAILRTRSESTSLHISAEILEFIATNITDNIRELEGALNRAIAWAQLHQTPLSLEQAKIVLSDLLMDTEPRVITPELILDCAADYFGFDVEEITGASRKRPLVIARQIAMYVMRTTTSLSLIEIGKTFGKRDHSTVIYAVDKITKHMKSDQRIYNQVSDLNQIIKTDKPRTAA